MNSHIEASSEGRRIFFISSAFIVFLILIEEYLYRVVAASRENISELQPILDRALISTTSQTIFHLSLAFFVLWLSSRVVKTRQWPPPGMRVPFRFKIQRIQSPTKVRLFVLTLLIMQCYFLFKAWHLYFWLLKNTEGLIK